MFKFTSVEFVGIGSKSSLRDRQWGSLILEFQDTETDHMQTVEIRTLLPKGPAVTMTELEEAARTQATAILEASLDLLRESTVAELLAREHAAEDEAEADADRSWNEQFSGVPKPFA